MKELSQNEDVSMSYDTLQRINLYYKSYVISDMSFFIWSSHILSSDRTSESKKFQINKTNSGMFHWNKS